MSNKIWDKISYNQSKIAKDNLIQGKFEKLIKETSNSGTPEHYRFVKEVKNNSNKNKDVKFNV